MDERAQLLESLLIINIEGLAQVLQCQLGLGNLLDGQRFLGQVFGFAATVHNIRFEASEPGNQLAQTVPGWATINQII